MKLYELQQNYMNLQALMEDEEVGAEIIEAALKEVKGNILEKAENYAIIIKNLEAYADGLEKEERRLANKKISLRAKAKTLKMNLEDCMLALGEKKIKSKLFSFNIQKNAPSVDILNEKLIPSEFYVDQAPVLDKKTLLAALKDGEEITGAKLKQTESLRIR